MAELKLIHFPAHSLLPSSLYLDHSHCLVLTPATLAALPSTRAIPDRDVFYVAFPKSSIRPLGFAHLCRSRPAAPFTCSYPRHFTLIARTTHVFTPAT